jgi:putative DNA primase/helicase
VPVTLPLEPAAADAFEAFQRANRDHEDESAGMLKSFVGKLPGLALRLSLVAELAGWAHSGGDEPRSISKATVEAVADFLESYALPMAARVYGDAALPPVERNAATIARYLLKHRLKALNARDLRRTAGLPGVRDADAVKEALEALVEASWLRPAPSREGHNPGRQRGDYLVNPAICGAANA